MGYRAFTIVTVITTVNLFILYGTYLNVSLMMEGGESIFLENVTIISTAETTENIISRQDSCILQLPDPWDPKIRHLFPNETLDYFSPMLWKGSPLVTTLNDGILSIINDSYICRYRCFALDHMDKQKFHKFVEFENQINVSCEFIDVSCDMRANNNGNKSNNLTFTESYRMSYAQAVKVTKVEERLHNGTYRPSVVVIIIDSLSHSSAKRRLPKTMQFLKDRMNATIFNGYAKVGLNSNPNGMAFLTGRMKEAPYGKSADAGGNSAAKTQSIWNDYKNRGYVTFYSEDDPFNFLFDRFYSAPTDHFLGPYWTHSHQIGARPQASHRVGLTYLNQLLQIYERNPLFALIWFSVLSHAQVNDLDDDYFVEFLNKSRDLLKDSFLIFMGDHGMRFGDLRSSAPGRMEDNLPFFSIALPQSLRNVSRSVQTNLQRNSQILTNHFDLYVTFWDILTFNISDLFTEQLNWPNTTKAVRGLSLLRPIPGNRTCHTLEMPVEYCPCYENTKNFTDSKLREQLAQFAVKTMNGIITSNCATLSLGKILDVEELIEQRTNNSDVYRIFLTTLPNNGTFQALLRHDRNSGNISKVTNLIDRINLFGNQSACVDNYTVQRYCYCKNQ